MIWFVTLAAPALMLGLFASLYAAWNRLTGWTPTPAHVTGTDYSEAERRADRSGWFERPSHLFDPRYGQHGRWTTATLAYDDADGHEHHTTYSHLVADGAPEEMDRVLWYDPANPDRTTFAGPAAFLFLAGGCMAGLAALWHFARAIAAA